MSVEFVTVFFSLLTTGYVLQTWCSHSLGGFPHQLGTLAKYLCLFFFVPLDPHAHVLYILGLQTASSPKVPRREDFHFSALQPHPRQTWLVHTHTQWRNGKETTLNNSTLETQYLLSIVTSSCCFSSCVPFCVNSHRCYQGEPILHPPKQHNSPSLPAHLPGTYLQFTPGDGKNNQCSYFKKIMSLFSGSRKTDWSLILPLPALSQFSKLYL